MFKNNCLICGKAVFFGARVCEICVSRLRSAYIDSYLTRCPVCNYPLVSDTYACKKCMSGSTFKVYNISDYQDCFSRQVLFDFKFHGKKELAPVIASVYREFLPKVGEGLLVPVPCSPASLKERGWNHMELIAAQLKPYRYCNLLSVNPSFNLEQKKLNREQRIESSKNKFCVIPQVVEDSHLILLDDIMTTGSTLKACREALPGYKISAITWFIEF